MSFKVEIVTPKGLFESVDVDSLTLKLTSGYRTILAGHTPLIGTLDYAPMHVSVSGKTKYYALHGGAINVKKDGVVIIANAIERSRDIDIARAKAAKARAEKRLQEKDPNIDMKRAELALKRAIARLEASNNH
jgi:F-type H+-transporting ATPase subunit epsilon